MQQDRQAANNYQYGRGIFIVLNENTAVFQVATSGPKLPCRREAATPNPAPRRIIGVFLRTGDGHRAKP